MAAHIDEISDDSWELPELYIRGLISTKAFIIVCQTLNVFGQVELSALFRSFADLQRAHCSQLMNTNRQAAAV